VEFAELTRKVGADFLQRRASPKRHS
jgi:hypothetical protein